MVYNSRASITEMVTITNLLTMLSQLLHTSVRVVLNLCSPDTPNMHCYNILIDLVVPLVAANLI